jgi:hypothetical protein
MHNKSSDDRAKARALEQHGYFDKFVTLQELRALKFSKSPAPLKMFMVGFHSVLYEVQFVLYALRADNGSSSCA